MLISVLFALLAVIDIILALSIFITKKTFHSVIFLIGIFIINSLFFMMLSQPLLALLQLIILVGGISVFMIVSVATESYKQIKISNVYKVVALSIFIIIALSTIILQGFQTSTTVETNSINSTYIEAELSGNIFAIYLLVLFVFLIALGSALMLGHLNKSKSNYNS
ncbi:MAG: NADH-quinone oxidoreductase subunit J [Candidatus Micrarchaeia archaeon]